MERKGAMGKLLLIGAGGGCLALVVFVVMPWLLPPAAPPEAMMAEEIMAEEPVAPVDTASDAMPETTTPLVALRDNGEEVAVLFPDAEEADTGQEPAAEGGLPPILSLEEIEAALSDPATEDVPSSESVEVPGAVAEAGEENAPASEALQAVVASPAGSPHVPWQGESMTLPPPEATREVQELLKELGYEPGPSDGIWGERTARAWRNFARDAWELEAMVQSAELAQITQTAEDAADASDAPPDPEESAPPSGGTGVQAAHGAEQAGTPQAGLPPGASVEKSAGMLVPGTLRGVMGYRLPLVSRQEVPDQVVSGVLIPAHTTFVILREGEWELVGLSADEVQKLYGGGGREEEAQPTKAVAEPRRGGWNPLRLFRRQHSIGEEE